MKLEIDTGKLKDVVGRIKDGVGNNQILPITCYLKLLSTESELIISATDGTNFIEEIIPEIESEKAVVLVNANQFINLVNKTTSKNVKFELKKDHLAFKGNGNYKLEILDEEFPTYDIEVNQTFTVHTHDYKDVLTENESAIAKDMTMPCLTGYYILDDKEITTDGIKMAINKKGLNRSEEHSIDSILIPSKLAKLTKNLQGETFFLYTDSKGKLLFESDNLRIFGTELSDKEDYPDITGLLELTYNSFVTIDKIEFEEALERINLFTKEEQDHGVNLILTEKEFKIETFDKSDKEVLTMMFSEVKEDMKLSVSLEYLRELVKALKDNEMNVCFEKEQPLKLTQNDIIQFLSDMEEE